MTRPAIGFAFDVVVANEFFARFELVRRRLPRHAKDLITRANKARGIAVTLETPRHLQRRCFLDERHLVNLSVTRGAADAFVDVNAVVEIHKIGKLIDAIPLNRRIGLRALNDGLQHGAGGEQLRMTVQAGFRRRHSRKG